MADALAIVANSVVAAASVAGKMLEGMGAAGMILAAFIVYSAVRVLIIPLVGYSGSSDKVRGKKEDG